MDFRILGPVEVEAAGRLVALGGHKQRALLAILLLHANQVVSTDRLVDLLWGESPPDTASKALQGNILALRKALEPDRRPDTAWGRVVTRPPGYLLRVERGELDLDRFEEHATEGRAALARGDPARAAALLKEALGLWRGAPLADVALAPFAETEARRLEETHLATLEERVDADLALGRHAELVGELEALVAREPLRERLRGQLMLCLYRCGRQAEALACYREGRERLVDELGIEPGTDLRSLHEAILRQDPALEHRTAPATRVVTFLLTDIERSTELWERDPAQMSAAIARHDIVLTETVTACGGTVVKSRGEGDSIFAVFEEPAAAVQAAIDGQLALAGEEWPTPEPLAVRMALHTGEAEVREGDFFGPVVIRCSRLRGIAHGGQILVSRATTDAVAEVLAPDVDLRSLGTFRLKGLSEPEHVFQVCHPDLQADFPEPGYPERGDESPLPPALQTRADRPFVGRARELEALRSRWQEACEGVPQLVPLAGEAGIGKTRLAGELAREFHDDGALVIYGRCDEEPLAAHQPFVEALRQLVRRSSLEIVRALPDAGELTRLLPELAARIPDLPSPLAGDPEGERYRLFDAVTALISAAARERPVALVLDDLHWADRSSVLLLKHLARRTGRARLLVLALYREGEIGRDHPLTQALADLRRDRDLERVVLTGLGPEEVAELVHGWSGDTAQPKLTSSLYERTEGHPFFLVELLRHADQAPVDVVPEGIRDLVRRRLDRLAAGTRRILPVAAVIGAAFEWELLVWLADLAPEELEDALDEAVAAMLIEEDAAGFGRFWFSHALVRETLYNDLSAIRRARLHHCVGEALEAIRGTDSAEAFPALAHHYFAGRQPEDVGKGIEYSIRAAEHATEQLAFEEAAAHYDRALEALEPIDRSEPQRCRVLLALGDVHWSAGAVVRARSEFARAAELAAELDEPEQLARAALGFGGQYPTFAVGVADPALTTLLERALRALGDQRTALRAMVMARLAVLHAYTPERERAGALAREAIEMARRSGDKRAVAEVLLAGHWTLGGPDNVHERVALTRELLDLGRELGDKRIESEGHGWGMSALLELGDREGADREQECFDRLTRALRRPFPGWAAVHHRALYALLDGRFAEAETIALEAFQQGQAAENPNAAMQFGVQLFRIRYEQGRIAEILDGVARFTQEYPSLPGWRCGLAWGHAEAGRKTDARRLLEDLTRDRCAALPRDLVWLTGVALLARTAARLEERVSAAVLYELLLPYADRCLVDSPGSVCSGSLARELGILTSTLERFDDAERHLRHALDVNVALRAPALAAQTRFDLASMLVARGQAGDREAARGLVVRVRHDAECMAMTRLLNEIARLESRPTAAAAVD